MSHKKAAVQIKKTPKDKLNYVLTWLAAGINPEYRAVNQAIYSVVRVHYTETLRLAEKNQAEDEEMEELLKK